MFIYFGPIIGVNSWDDYDYLGLANHIVNSDIVGLSIVEDSLSSDVFYDSRSVAAFFSLIEVAMKPVFVRVGVSPSNFRTSPGEAVSNAMAQMQEIVSMFRSYNLSGLLRGFIMQVSTFQTYADGTKLTRSHVNDLINTAHIVHNKAVAIMATDSVDILSPTAAQSSRTQNTPGSVVSKTAIGTFPSIEDVIIHMNPIYSIHLADSARPFETVDWSRMLGVLAMAKATASSSIRHAIVQGPIRDWDNNNQFAHSDSLIGMTMDYFIETAFRNASQVFNACGFSDVALVADSAMGANSNIALDTAAFPLWPDVNVNVATQNAPSWGNIFSENGLVTISWMPPEAKDAKKIVVDSLLNIVSGV